MTKLFGTDGVRGIANRELTPELALRIGRAGALSLMADNRRNCILIGRDPRISGHMLEGALIAGITSAGVDVISVGVVPTPAVAYLTKTLGCCGGVMISASHNPLQDNGIKFFGEDGFKLSQQWEKRVESLIPGDNFPRPIAADLGRVFLKPEAGQRYLQYLKKQVPLNLKGVKIALDCAHGATASFAPQLLRELGAQVNVFFHEPNGLNINEECGSTFPGKIQKLTKETGAHAGFAFDGDGDRVLAADEEGNLLDGDHILAIIGLHMLENGRLPAGKIVTTPYSNGGLRQAFQDANGDVIYAAVGDRFVVEAMLKEGSVLGGEQSGHIIFLENSTTGDGLLTALKLLEIFQLKGQPFTKLAQSMIPFPQRLVNVPVSQKDGWQENSRIQAALHQAQAKMQPLGRLLVRASGTEPLIRIFGEHPDEKILQASVDYVADVVQREQGRSLHAN